MSSIDQTDTEGFDLCWARGDDDPKTFTIRNSVGAAVDISTWTMSLAVNVDKDPLDTANEVFVVAGVFLTDGTDGKMVFTPPPNSLDAVEAPSTAYYDVNRITPSKKTILKARVWFIMDIDKG